MRKVIIALSLVMAVSLTFSANAAISVNEPNFVVDYLLEDCQGNVYQIDGQTPRLEAITNPDYGFGVVAASMDQGILQVLRISQSSVELFATASGWPSYFAAYDLRFDTTGLYANRLYLSVVPRGLQFSPYTTGILEISPDGVPELITSIGGSQNVLTFLFDFTEGSGGYSQGIYLEDTTGTHGTSLYHLNVAFDWAELGENSLPSGRSDLDIYGMEFDPTGLYGHYLTMADSDLNQDQNTVIYQLLPDLSWVELTDVEHTDNRYYRDMCFSNGGSFGQMLYVTERRTETVMSVDANGVHTIFASGFSGVESVTVTEDGEHMFISDVNGIYRIRSVTTVPGPALVMQEPKVDSDGVHTNPSGIDNVRLLFSGRVQFANSDVNIANANDVNVPFSVSGSNSQFMVIAFGQTLLHDKYTITIHDSVLSSETGASIDGDNSGMAGGDAVIVMEHRQRHDSDNDNHVDFTDLSAFAEKWLWTQ